jgi:asparagine synthase (glutamine-hydrolysing)
VSGIVGIFQLNGAPIDQTLLAGLTNSLAFRGPDAQRIWCRGPIGFGHTLLQSSLESKNERQPLSLDGNLHIVADARIDGRRDLIATLRSHGQLCSEIATDAELILRAYTLWEDACLERLAGDFVFAIWNARRRRLFCARDQMGVKPFFYARLGSLFMFSNTLNCIRLHPAVSPDLNELSIADFLLFDMIQDPSATSFKDVLRLAPAHALTCEGAKISVKRYWSASPTEPLGYRRASEYVEHFRFLLDQAVADRMRTESVCISMSGGLDSPTVAAGAKRVDSRSGNATELWALTQVFEKLIPDNEKHYAGLVAEALDIPIRYRSCDDARLFQYASVPTPEPKHLAWPDLTADHLRAAAAKSRVVLTGLGADPLFSARITVHFRQLFSQRNYKKAAADAVHYLTRERRFSRMYLRTRFRLLFRSREDHSGFFPDWLNEDFASQHDLRSRWEMHFQQAHIPDCARPEAYQATFSNLWPDLFGAYDAGASSVPVEVRHPFFDLRLVQFLLALPRLPWCCDKELLRESARGVLPDQVRLRRKTPLRTDPMMELLNRDTTNWMDFEPVPEIQRFVVRARIPPITKDQKMWPAWVNFRAFSLNCWLRSSALQYENVDYEGSLHEVGAAAY